MKALFIALLLVGSFAQAATTVVEGTIKKVVPAEKEIYVQGSDKVYEYYFNDKTTVTKGGQPGTYEDLKKDMKVKVTAEKKGKRLDPKTVEIVQ